MAAVSTSTTNTHSSIRLTGNLGQILRRLWLAFTLMAIILLAISLPASYEEQLIVCDGDNCSIVNIPSETATRYEEFGISLETVALNNTVLGGISALVFIVIASIIFFSRPNELIALMTVFAFVGIGTAGPIDYLQPNNPLWDAGLRIAQIIGHAGLIGFTLTFPNGRFVPKWSRWVFPIVIILSIISNIFVFFDVIAPDVPNTIVFPIILPAMTALIYRYFRVANPKERQQIKWVAASIALIVPLFLFAFFIESGIDSPFFDLGFSWFGAVTITLLPVTVLVSILQYGLWNIDFYINRGIVYLSLTVILGLVFAGLFFLLQSIFTAVLGSSQSGLALILPTAVVFGLFNPARTRLRHFVDRRFYGIKMDYTRVVESRQKILATVDTSTTIGQYRTTTMLGSGGMGEVYTGESTNGERVAIKVLHTRHEQNKEIEQRFIREASATARLEHPNIVKIREVGEDGGRLFIAMEYVEGQDWGAILKAQGKIPLEQALPRLQEMASALDYVHENGIIHRDIKPSNIMLEAETNRAILMDFGIAKIATELTALTGTSQIVGSLDYISPEQIKGQENIDHRTDIYSFAVMTYQLLTGKLPFHKANVGGLVMAHLIQPPPDASEINPQIPSSVAEVIMRGMAKEPEERYQSVSDFVAHLSRN